MHTKSPKKINEIAGFSKEKLLEMNALSRLTDKGNFLNKMSDIVNEKKMDDIVNEKKMGYLSKAWNSIKGIANKRLNKNNVSDKVIKKKLPKNKNVSDKVIKKGKEFFKIYEEVCNKYDVKPVPIYSKYGAKGREKYVGFVFIKNNELTISYRGTKDWHDFGNDLNIQKKEPWPDELMGRAHKGFYSAFHESLDSLQKILIAQGVFNDNTDYKINFIGFSLGGAVAQIAALHFRNLGVKNISVATFGSPRVFSNNLAREFDRILGMKSIRVKNPGADPIPHLPTSLRFNHAGIELLPPVLYGTHNLSSYEENISKISEKTFNVNNIHLNIPESIPKEHNHKLPKDFYIIPDRIGKNNTEIARERLSTSKQDQTLDVSTELNNVNVKESKISPVK